MKRWIAAMLMLLLLTEMLPVYALAVAVSGKILTEDELKAYLVLAGLNDGAGEYHEGMAVNASMNAAQVSAWLDEQLLGDLYSVGNVIARAQTALYKLENEAPEDYRAVTSNGGEDKIARLNALMVEAEDLRQTLRYANDTVDESQTIIQAMTDLMDSDQVYDYEKARYSERIRQAGGYIQQVRQQVMENADAWLKQINDMQNAVDGTREDSEFGAWLHSLFDDTFTQVVTEAPVMFSKSANTITSRLGPNSSVLSGDTASVTVLGKDTIGIVFYDKDGKHAPDGIKVSVRDADGDAKAPLATDTTGSGEKDGGWVAFNIHDFKADEDGYVDVYMEVDASAVRDDSTGMDKYQSFCLPSESILRGTKYNVTLKDNDGSPYLYKATFNDSDIIYNEHKFFYTKANDMDFDFVLETRNLKDDDPRAPILVYEDSDGTPKTAAATKHEGNKYTYTDTWKRILSPSHPDVYIRFGAASNASGADVAAPGADGDIPTMLKPVNSVFEQPADLSPFLKGMSGGINFGFKIPGINRLASLDLTSSKLEKWMPKVNVDISGTVTAAVGYMPDAFNPNPKWKSQKMKDYDKFYKDIQKVTNRKNWKQNCGILRDAYKDNKINWLSKGGLTIGFYFLASAKWKTDKEDNVTYLKITGVGGVSFSFYVNITFQTSAGAVPLYANLNINLSFSVALGVNLDFILNKDDAFDIKSWKLHLDDFTFEARLTVSVTLSIGIKGVASVWVKGAGYIDFAVHDYLSRGGYSLNVTGGANVSAGFTFLFATFSVVIWEFGPYNLYSEPKSAACSLLDHYMPEINADDGKKDPVTMGPETYPDLPLAAKEVLSKLDDTLDVVKIVTLGDDLYTFNIQGGRLCWRNVTKNLTGSIVDAINRGRQLYPDIYNFAYVVGNVKDYDFEVTTTAGEVVGDSDYKPGVFATVAALCAGSFDDNGYPLEVENNVCLYVMHLWRAGDGSLSCSMNGDESRPGFFSSAWIGGQDALVDFIGSKPAIELVTSRVTVDSDNSYTYDNAVDVELPRIERAFMQREQIVASVSMKQSVATALTGGKPNLGSMKVTNNQAAADDGDVASGAGDDYVRVFHLMGPDDSWLAVSRSDNGDGEEGAIEFYDTSMDVAGDDDMTSVVLDRANTERFAQALIPRDGGQYARVIFYIDDVATQDDEGSRKRLKSLYLEPTDHKEGAGNLELLVSASSYDIDMPTGHFKQQTIGVAVNLYWLASVVLKDKNGNNYDAYRVMIAVYDQTTNTLSNATVCAEFTMPDSSLAIRDLFLSPTGKGYLTASPVPNSISEDGTDEKTPLSLYSFQTNFKPVLDIKGLVFEETLVSPSEFDDYSVSIMNSGNMGVIAFDMEMVLIENGNETVVGTLHADCLTPEQSSMKMGGTQVSSGAKAFTRVFDFDLTPQRRDWLVSEKNLKYVVEGGIAKAPEETDQQIDYVKTDVILPGALAAFKSTMQIPSSWDGRKELEVRITGHKTNTNWVGAMALAANRSTISASRNGPAANSAGEDITYVRDPETGVMVLQSDGPKANALAAI